MKTLANIDVNMKFCSGNVAVVEWAASDPFPELGASVGIDTETELITETRLDPSVVVLGCFDSQSMTCYIVYWQDVPAFMRELCSRDIQQRYFNLGFDEQVIDNEDDTKPLLAAIDAGLVRDMQIRIQLNDVATVGFIRNSLSSLAGASAHYLDVKLDKGDGTEASARLSFRRKDKDGNPYRLTDEQVRYLPFDCITTWALGEAVKEQPTEVTHTKGMVCLAHVSANGFPVDRQVHAALVKLMEDDEHRQRDKLISFGFPDPYKDEALEAKHEIDNLMNSLKLFLRNNGADVPNELLLAGIDGEDGAAAAMPNKTQMRRIIAYLYAIDGTDDTANAAACVAAILKEGGSFGKAEKQLYDELMEDIGALSIDEAKRKIVMPAFLGRMLEALNRQLAESPVAEVRKAAEKAAEYLDDHQDWFAKEAAVKPTVFFQEHVKQVMAANPKLQLDMTEKSKLIQLTKTDMWKLHDLGIDDKFLEAYTSFKHAQKYKSTYLDTKYIKSDGKIHARFQNLVRTGRTSCVSPNLQNYPSRDKAYPLKNMFMPPEGTILCATDFGFAELCAFGQACYTRFGHSVMRDIINAGFDPHYWFAGITKGIIDADLSRIDDRDWVDATSKFLKENVTKAERQGAKCGNFGSKFRKLALYYV